MLVELFAHKNATKDMKVMKTHATIDGLMDNGCRTISNITGSDKLPLAIAILISGIIRKLAAADTRLAPPNHQAPTGTMARDMNR